MQFKIPKEWYEILYKVSKEKRIPFSEFIRQIYDSNECLNLPYVNYTEYKIVNVNCDCRDLIKHLKYYLFCQDE